MLSLPSLHCPPTPPISGGGLWLEFCMILLVYIQVNGHPLCEDPMNRREDPRNQSGRQESAAAEHVTIQGISEHRTCDDPTRPGAGPQQTPPSARYVHYRRHRRRHRVRRRRRRRRHAVEPCGSVSHKVERERADGESLLAEDQSLRWQRQRLRWHLSSHGSGQDSLLWQQSGADSDGGHTEGRGVASRGAGGLEWGGWP